MSEAKGTRKQVFNRHHAEYIALLKDGLTDLEVMQLLGISLNQLRRHQAQAFAEGAARTVPEYATMLWADLPFQLKRMLPTKDENAQIIRIEHTDAGALVSLHTL